MVLQNRDESADSFLLCLLKFLFTILAGSGICFEFQQIDLIFSESKMFCSTFCSTLKHYIMISCLRFHRFWILLCAKCYKYRDIDTDRVVELKKKFNAIEKIALESLGSPGFNYP